MPVTVGTFNLNNLVGRFDFRALIDCDKEREVVSAVGVEVVENLTAVD